VFFYFTFEEIREACRRGVREPRRRRKRARDIDRSLANVDQSQERCKQKRFGEEDLEARVCFKNNPAFSLLLGATGEMYVGLF